MFPQGGSENLKDHRTDALQRKKRNCQRGEKKWESQGHRGQGRRDLRGGRVDSSVREVKWNDPEKCLLEFQEEVTELFKK